MRKLRIMGLKGYGVIGLWGYLADEKIPIDKITP